MMNGTTLRIEPPRSKLSPTAITDVPPSIPTSAAPIPANAAVGSDKLCGRWYEVEAGDYCKLVTLKYAISLPDFVFLNTGINSNCTNLFAAESYCVQAVGDINTYPGPPGYMSITIDPSATFTRVPFIMLPNGTMTAYPRPSPDSPLAKNVRDGCVYYFDGDDYQFTADQLGLWNSNHELAASTYNVDYDNFAAWNSLAVNVTDPAYAFQTGQRYCGSWGLQPTRTQTTGPAPPAGTDDGKPKPSVLAWHHQPRPSRHPRQPPLHGPPQAVASRHLQARLTPASLPTVTSGMSLPAATRVVR